MRRLSLLFFAWLYAIVAFHPVYGETLIYDGVPLGAQETGGYTKGASIQSTYPTNGLVGFEASRVWESGGSTGAIRAFLAGLSFPDCFALASITNMGGSFGFTDTGTSPAVGRGVYRQFAVDFAWPTSGSVFLRALIRFTAGASLGDGNYWGVGLEQTPFIGGSSASPVYHLTTNGLWFAIKNDNGVTQLVMRVRGEDQTLLPSVTGGVTYLCLARIDIGKGTDGTEIVRGYAVPIDGFTGQLPTYSASVQAELIGGDSPLAYLAIAGQNQTNGKAIQFDEFAAATSLYDLVYIDPRFRAGGFVIHICDNGRGVPCDWPRPFCSRIARK